MAPLDLAVLVRPAGLDVAMADATAFDGQEEGEGKLRAAICLQRADAKREGSDDLAQEVEAREYAQASIQAQDSEPSAIIDGGVLVGFRAGDLNDFDLDRFRRAAAKGG